MALQAGKDYVHVPTVDVSDGVASSAITKAILVGTKSFVFLVPVQGIELKGSSGTQTDWQVGGQDPASAVAALLAQPDLTAAKLEEMLQSLLKNLPQRRVLAVKDADVFQVKTGWLTGGLYFRQANEPRRTVNLRGKQNKLAVKAFYQGLER